MYFKTNILCMSHMQYMPYILLVSQQYRKPGQTALIFTMACLYTGDKGLSFLAPEGLGLSTVLVVE